MKQVTYQQQKFSIEGCISVEETEDWVRPWRIDYRYLDLYPGLEEIADESAGVRLVFQTSSIDLLLELVEPDKDMKVVLFVDGLFIQEVRPQNDRIIFNPLPPGNKKIILWLDQRFPFQLKSVMIDDNAEIGRAKINQQRWIHYGSSISQSNDARSPANTWTALVAQQMNLHLTNLAFRGECKLDPMIARLIRDLPADYITLKLGINIYEGDLSSRTFASNVIGMIQIIREKHPQTPLTVISPIFSCQREMKNGGCGLNIQEIRYILEDTVAFCQKYGDKHLSYVDGLNLFGPAEEFYLPDGLHPDSEGQFIIAKGFLKEVFKKSNEFKNL